MSLLIKALEQAAKDRNTTRSEPQAGAVPRQPGEPAREPTLEPPPPPRPVTTFDETATPHSAPAQTRNTVQPLSAPARPPAQPHSAPAQPLSVSRPAPAAAMPSVEKSAPQRRTSSVAAGSLNTEVQQRARAAAVMQAGGGAAQHMFAYLRGNPVMMLAAIAVLFGIAFGIYVYLQIARPGMFVRQASAGAETAAPPVAAPNASESPASAAPPQGPSSAGPLQPMRTSENSGSTTAAASPASGAIAAAAISPPPSAPATESAAANANAPEPSSAASPVPGLIAASSIVANAGRGETAPPAERAPERRQERPNPRASADAPKSTGSAAGQTPAPEAGGGKIAVSLTTVQPRVNPSVSQAYALLQSGNLDEARSLYDRVIQSEPLNVDALLGLAYIAAQENRSDDALKAYLRILQLNPRHAIAQAALIGLMGRADPVASETRLKQLLAREPSAFLHFVLGNLYADQALWNQAQQAYFQAHHLEPDNPDYAYNLAVGLDHLGQGKFALEFYRRAERSATQHGRSNFNLSHARERISSLTSQLE